MRSEVPIAAVSLGARIIEKHIIMDRAIPTADAPFSLTPAEFAQLVKSVRIVEKAIGTPSRAIGPKAEESLQRKWRRSIYAQADIAKGEPFVREKRGYEIEGFVNGAAVAGNVRSIRPSLGLHTKHWDTVLASVATRDIKRGEPLTFDMLAKADQAAPPQPPPQ